MKKLLIIALLSPLFCFGQYRNQTINRPVKLSYEQQEIKKRTMHVIIAQTVLFGIAEYCMQTGNKKAYDKTAIAFAGISIGGAIYIFDAKKTDKRYKKSRIWTRR